MDHAADFTRTIRLAVPGRRRKLTPEMLRELPKISLLDFLRHTDRYQNPGFYEPRPERLQYPLPKSPHRIAVVGQTVRESLRVRCFENFRSEALWQYAPEAIAAPLDLLRAMYATGRQPRRPLNNALIVYTGILQGPMTENDADRFWRIFEVPVFEQFLGLDGELLAWECDIHHGLHVRQEAAYFESDEDDRITVSFLANPRLPGLRLETGLAGQIVHDPCPCGESSPRIVNLRRRVVQRKARHTRMAEAGALATA